MKLYHGTIADFNYIDLSFGDAYKDFGNGFYATANKKQAEQMANRKYKFYKGTNRINKFVYNFEFD